MYDKELEQKKNWLITQVSERLDRLTCDELGFSELLNAIQCSHHDGELREIARGLDLALPA